MALGTVLNGDGPQSTAGTLQNLLGRTTELALEWGALEQIPDDIPLPIIAVQFLPFRQTGADNDTRNGIVQFTVFAEGNDAQQTCDNIAERIEMIVTASALLAQGVDAAPLEIRRITLPMEREFTRALHRADIEITIEGMKVPTTP